MPFLRADDGPLAVLTLDHGELNLFDREVLDSFEASVRTLAADPPRGLLIDARGRVVSGGVDVHTFDGMSARAGRGAVGGAARHDRAASRTCRARRCSRPTRCA